MVLKGLRDSWNLSFSNTLRTNNIHFYVSSSNYTNLIFLETTQLLEKGISRCKGLLNMAFTHCSYTEKAALKKHKAD